MLYQPWPSRKENRASSRREPICSVENDKNAGRLRRVARRCEIDGAAKQCRARDATIEDEVLSGGRRRSMNMKLLAVR